MNLQTIIQEADTRVPNAFSTGQKVDWLNEVNHEFFDVVKIPKFYSAAANGTTGVFTLPTDAREKNIRKIVVGSTYYRSMLYEDITASYNYYTLDESTSSLSLNPTPSVSTVMVVYDKIPNTSFVSTVLTSEPEAPKEYHWLYILGLCVRIAKAMNDAGLANNYEGDFKANLSVAQQNYLR